MIRPASGQYGYSDEPTVCNDASCRIDATDQGGVNNRFTPPAIQVRPFVKIIWKNVGTVPHTVTSGQEGAPDGQYRKFPLSVGEEFSRVFDKPGEYAYYCQLHPGTKGKIVVSGEPVPEFPAVGLMLAGVTALLLSLIAVQRRRIKN